MEDHGSSLIWLQPPETPVELVVIVDRAGVISCRRLEVRQPNLDGLAHPPSSLVSARIDDEPVQPRLPALGIAEFRQALPGAHEGLLDGVVRLVGIAQHKPGEAVQAINGGRREDLECLVVAVTRGFDEIGLQGSLRPSARSIGPARQYMTLACGQPFKKRRGVLLGLG